MWNVCETQLLSKHGTLIFHFFGQSTSPGLMDFPCVVRQPCINRQIFHSRHHFHAVTMRSLCKRVQKFAEGPQSLQYYAVGRRIVQECAELRKRLQESAEACKIILNASSAAVDNTVPNIWQLPVQAFDSLRFYEYLANQALAGLLII